MWDEDYISRQETAVWGRGGGGMKAISTGWRLQSRAGGRWDEDYISRLGTAFWGWGKQAGDRILGLGEGGMKTISAGWRPQSGAGGEEGGMKAISAGWRPQSRYAAGRMWDEDYISRLETAVWGWGKQAGDRSLGLREGRWDEGYISRLETAVLGWGWGDGMKTISAGWRPQSGAEGGEVG
ncbi:hypothetical protein RRG08_053734 [Elysia crispata]|uniref:Uncharacterized protein n=1 Tax=Elysia crispata TaxID=231223 RepID=A0AAE0XY32_9GAST|nr:hypothetical protein RRG08_053734 [Elysia crispata]